MRQQLLGQFENHNKSGAQSLELSYSISSKSTTHDWNKNHINSSFVANYAGQVAADLNPDVSAQLSTLSDTVNYVANEMLEQAMLCHLSAAERVIRIKIRISDTNIRLYIKNRVDPDTIDVLTDQLLTILTEDPTSRYIRHLQNGYDSPCDNLRYLTMIVDHEVDIAWKIEQADNNAKDAWVTTMTRVPIQNYARYPN